MNHMTYVGFSISLANIFLFGEEEGNSQDPSTIIVEKKTKDIETFVSTADHHKQKGKSG